MPNIQGEAEGFQEQNASGAIYLLSGGRALVYNINTTSDMVKLCIDASRSNSEYGKQPTVMPASVDVIEGIYLGRTA